ncbi:hypothetical protein [Sphingomonas baiyangensis]|uniref:Rho termination factor, N-terminal domain n=1 Tax=Sphingomonas baiyangensis TaxID=2572576 RepID=A0A4U1L220_9SPHN|nr:hypothetical protein [Sphingomonas baiyangensis]TKD50213.1 hypothetical protein FBR43_05180 [Sphingomonas baiyangensis]
MADIEYIVSNPRKTPRTIFVGATTFKLAPGGSQPITMSDGQAADERAAGMTVKPNVQPDTPQGKADDLPGLTGKSKADLLAIAADEGVDANDDMTNAEIRAAIEAGRA